MKFLVDKKPLIFADSQNKLYLCTTLPLIKNK